MKRRMVSLAMALVLAMLLALTAYATTTGETLVMDDAGLLTASQAAELESRLQTISSAYNAQVVVATVSAVENGDVDRFIEYVYDEMDLGYGAGRDGVLLLVCMDPREYRILTNGMADEAIGASGIDIIGDNIVSYLSDGDYAGAFRVFAEDCEYYLNGHLNGYPFDPFGALTTAVVIGFVIALIVVLILKGQLKSVHRKYQADVYVRPGSMQLTVDNDLFLYSTIDRRRKEKSSSGSSGSSGSSRSVGGGSF